MSDENGSANPQDTSGAQGKSDKVSYETYQRVLAEAKAAKERAKAAEAIIQQAQENKLKEQNEWKTLAEQKEREALEEKAKRAELESTILESVKLSAFQKHLGGRIKDEAYFQFVETDRIAYNPDTKRVDEESAKLVAADFIKRHPSLVEFKSGRMPNEAASQGKISDVKIDEMTPDDLKKHIKFLHSQGKI